MRRITNVNHYLSLANSSYAKGWEKAVRRLDELEKYGNEQHRQERV